MPHLSRLEIHAGAFPTRERYPFSLAVLQQTPAIDLSAPVTFFVGENGAGKSTVLEAIAHRCRIPIWAMAEGQRVEVNPYEHALAHCLRVHWTNGPVPGSYFSAQIFREFAIALDGFAASDPGQLRYFGGASLMTQSHGQSLMAYFQARYRLRGLYLLDEPETALSPTSQLALVHLITAMAAGGHAQFIICSHSPILLACPGANLYTFDQCPIAPIAYEATTHYRVYRAFMQDPRGYLDASHRQDDPMP
jgi:predicted ATPase